jgi:hypothetical protein
MITTAHGVERRLAWKERGDLEKLESGRREGQRHLRAEGLERGRG